MNSVFVIATTFFPNTPPIKFYWVMTKRYSPNLSDAFYFKSIEDAEFECVKMHGCYWKSSFVIESVNVYSEKKK